VACLQAVIKRVVSEIPMVNVVLISALIYAYANYSIIVGINAILCYIYACAYLFAVIYTRANPCVI